MQKNHPSTSELSSRRIWHFWDTIFLFISGSNWRLEHYFKLTIERSCVGTNGLQKNIPSPSEPSSRRIWHFWDTIFLFILGSNWREVHYFKPTINKSYEGINGMQKNHPSPSELSSRRIWNSMDTIFLFIFWSNWR